MSQIEPELVFYVKGTHWHFEIIIIGPHTLSMHEICVQT